MFNEYVYVYAYDVYIFLLTYILTKYQFSGFFYNNTSTSTIKYNQVQSSTIKYNQVSYTDVLDPPHTNPEPKL